MLVEDEAGEQHTEENIANTTSIIVSKGGKRLSPGYRMVRAGKIVFFLIGDTYRDVQAIRLVW